MEQRELNIIAQNSANVAAQLYGPSGEDFNEEVFNRIRTIVLDGTIAILNDGKYTSQVTASAPKSYNRAGGNNRGFVPETAAPVDGSAISVQGKYSPEALIADLRAYPENWEAQAPGGKAAYRHKTVKEANSNYKLTIWANQLQPVGV